MSELNFHNWYALSDNGIMKEIGGKLKQIRLNKNFTQIKLSEITGLDRATISQIENGKPTSLNSFIRILRAFNMLEKLDRLLYIPDISPIEMLKLESKKKKRASKK